MNKSSQPEFFTRPVFVSKCDFESGLSTTVLLWLNTHLILYTVAGSIIGGLPRRCKRRRRSSNLAYKGIRSERSDDEHIRKGSDELNSRQKP